MKRLVGRSRPLILLVALVLTVLAAGGWVVPSGNAQLITGGWAVMPDPAALGTGSSAYLYGSSDLPSGSGGVAVENWTPGTSSATGANSVTFSASHPPSSYGITAEWGPDVQYLSSTNTYVMWFSGKQQTTYWANNLYVATSSTPTGPFTILPADTIYGAQDKANMVQPIGLIDPELWTDHYGNWFLIYSEQDGAADPSNAIYSQPMNTNALTPAAGDPAYVLTTYGSLTAAGWPTLGPNAQVENPAFTVDPQGGTGPQGGAGAGYDWNLTLSWGSWDTTNGYTEINLACDGLLNAAPCEYVATENNFDAELQGSNSSIQNAAAASYFDQGASGANSDRYLVFAAAGAGTNPPCCRAAYYDSTNMGALDTAATPQILYNGQCLCNPDGWYLIMQSDGNLVLYNASGVAAWNDQAHGGLKGDSSSYADMQNSDGNLVIYDHGSVLWQSGTSVHPGAYLKLQNNDNNLVIYTVTNGALWQTGT